MQNTNKAAANKLGYIGKKPGTRQSNDWYTPDEYIDAVRSVLGKIDLDPFSSESANKRVKATTIFTKDNTSLDKQWGCKQTFMNPPYSGQLCKQAVAKFIEQYEKYNFEGIILVNNATDTKWFNYLLDKCSSICFTRGRISFWNSDGKNISGNTRGQAFFYFGRHTDKFKDVFAKYGTALSKV